MKYKTIFDLLQMYINKDPMPKRIKYDMIEDGYEYFRWNGEEYVCETDEKCFLNPPWHHYMDEVEIVDEPSQKGKWLINSEKDIYVNGFKYREYIVECSQCGKEYRLWKETESELKTCPNCGADMRTKEKNNV